MGAIAAVHPTDPILQAYHLGKLDDFPFESVRKHLQACGSCRRRVAELSSDVFLGRFQTTPVKRLAQPKQEGPTWESLIDFEETELLPRTLAKGEKQRSVWLWPAVVGALLLGLLALWAAVVLVVKTPNGNLVLENVPKDAVVELDGEKVTVNPPAGKPIEIQLKPGKHGVVVMRDDVVLAGESVTIESGKDRKLTVRRH